MLPLSSSRIIDLTHVISEDIPTWNEGEGFTQSQIRFINITGSNVHQLHFKKAGLGTHFDSAAHFGGDRW
ncbi:unnamed protein product, partial [Didymodactylos carnosus]